MIRKANDLSDTYSVHKANHYLLPFHLSFCHMLDRNEGHLSMRHLEEHCRIVGICNNILQNTHTRMLMEKTNLENGKLS